MDKETLERYTEMSVQLFDFIIYNSVDFFEEELRELRETAGPISLEQAEFEMLVLKSYLMDYILSGEYGPESEEKEIIMQVYYHHFEQFLMGAGNETIGMVQERLKGYSGVLEGPSEFGVLQRLAVQYGLNVIKETDANRIAQVAAYAVYVLNDLIQRVHNIIKRDVGRVLVQD